MSLNYPFSHEIQCSNCFSKHTLLEDHCNGTIVCQKCGYVTERGICDFSAMPKYKDANGAYLNTGTGQLNDSNLTNHGVGVDIGSLGHIGKRQSLKCYAD